MALKVTVAPAELPVTLDEVKAHLRETKATEDADIMSKVRTVIGQLDGPEGLLNRALITQTLEMTVNRFWGWPLVLRLPPMVSVTSITYLDVDGDSQTLATSEYRVLNAATPTAQGRIELAFGSSWPSTRAVEQAVTITYVAGYGARNDVPEYIRHLILVMVKMLFDEREPMTAANMVKSPALQGLWHQAHFPAVA